MKRRILRLLGLITIKDAIGILDDTIQMYDHKAPSGKYPSEMWRLQRAEFDSYSKICGILKMEFKTYYYTESKT